MSLLTHMPIHPRKLLHPSQVLHQRNFPQKHQPMLQLILQLIVRHTRLPLYRQSHPVMPQLQLQSRHPLMLLLHPQHIFLLSLRLTLQPLLQLLPQLTPRPNFPLRDLQPGPLTTLQRSRPIAQLDSLLALQLRSLHIVPQASHPGHRLPSPLTIQPVNHPDHLLPSHLIVLPPNQQDNLLLNQVDNPPHIQPPSHLLNLQDSRLLNQQ